MSRKSPRRSPRRKFPFPSDGNSDCELGTKTDNIHIHDIHIHEHEHDDDAPPMNVHIMNLNDSLASYPSDEEYGQLHQHQRDVHPPLTSMLLRNPQQSQNNNNNSNETLLPRKRSQATKSPIPPEALAAAGTTSGDVNSNGMSSSVATEAAESMTMMDDDDTEAEIIPRARSTRRDLKTTPHEIKKSSSQILLNNIEGQEGGNELKLLKLNSNGSSSSSVGNKLMETRASLNASFDAAAASASVSVSLRVRTPTPTMMGIASAIKSNPRYTSPKRRKQSFDLQDPVIIGQNNSKQPGQQQQQQQQQQSQSFTPLRPPNTTQKRGRNKQGMDGNNGINGLLFSPKPVYSDEKNNHQSTSGSGSNNNKLPPRPSSGNPGGNPHIWGRAGGSFSPRNGLKAVGVLTHGSGHGSAAVGSASGATSTSQQMSMATPAPSSPLTPSPKYALGHTINNGLSNSSSFESSSNGGSPSTPFKFHSFPASLPRVHPRRTPGAGGGEDGTSNPVTRLADSLSNDSSNNSNNNNNNNNGMGSATRVSLRPKPTAGSNYNSSAMRPPPSPATRRLFLRNSKAGENNAITYNSSSLGNNNNNGGIANKLFASSFDTNDATESNSTTTINGGDRDNNGMGMLMTTIQPSSSHDQDQNDISGDWSEATSIRSLTNERIRMSNVPSHVDTISRLNYSALNDLEEEINGNGDEVDTVVMEEEDDLDDESESEKIENDGVGGEGRGLPSMSLLGTKLNFSSPPPPGEGAPSTGGRKTLKKINSNDPSESLESSLHPHTPRGFSAEQFHNIHNLEVSPIVRLPEDIDDHEMVDESLDKGIIEPKVAHDGKLGVGGSKECLLRDAALVQPLFREMASPILPDKSTEEMLMHRSSNNDSVDTSDANSSTTMIFSTGNNSSSAVDTTASTANINNTTLNTTNISNITRPTARKLRPMPDTSAFDLGTPSQHSLGSKDSGFNSHKTGATGSDQRLLCPPTPIRTPAWAHAAGVQSGSGQQPGLKRANSLISTKVLAACPPRVLDNLSSLEDSMLENDISGSTMDSTADRTDGSHFTNPTGSSFAPVMEEEKSGYSSLNESGFRSLEDHGASSDQIISPAFQKQEAMSSDVDMHMKPDGVPPSPAKLSKNKSRLSIEEPSDPVMTFSDFDNLGILGSGAFADVYKVRSKKDRRFYAIKRTRRQFRGVKDRERAMAEVHTMKRLQNALLSEAADNHDQQQNQHNHSSSNKGNYGLYLLFFIRAWQQDGFFYCQTELCSRATCRHLRLSLWSDWERDVVRYPSLHSCMLETEATSGNAKPSKSVMENHSEIANRLIPERAIWQICHDISRGLFHIHSYSMVHYDIKPSNIFFVSNSKWGTICKIGDFGLAGDVGTKDDGQEGDTAYMPSELLKSSCAKHPGADIFSLGLALYEMAAAPNWSLPREGDRWHELRNGAHDPDLPLSRSPDLIKLIRNMICPNVKDRPSADDISELDMVKRANATSDSFLSRYINDVERYDSRREREMESAEEEARRRSSTPTASMFNQYAALGSETVHRRAAQAMRTPTHTNDDELSFFG